MKKHNSNAKKQKGSTLVEVLVAVTVFLIVMGTLVAGYFSAKRVVIKQKELIYFEAICDDINKYGDVYGKKWDTKYFESYMITDATTGVTTEEPVACYIVYYNANYEPILSTDATSTAAARFALTYYYDPSGNLVVSVKNTVSDYYIVENLNYGSSHYLETSTTGE